MTLDRVTKTEPENPALSPSLSLSASLHRHGSEIDDGMRRPQHVAAEVVGT